MSRYIDADKLKKHYEWWENENKELFDSIVDLQPTVNVLVVKCKNCKFFKEFRDSQKEKSVDGLCMKAMLHKCDEQLSLKSNDDFCSNGEKWEKE